MFYVEAAASRDQARWGGVGGKRRLTSDPADRLIPSLQWPPLSLLFTSLKECRGGVIKEQAGIMKLVLGGVGRGRGDK